MCKVSYAINVLQRIRYTCILLKKILSLDSLLSLLLSRSLILSRGLFPVVLARSVAFSFFVALKIKNLGFPIIRIWRTLFPFYCEQGM